MSIQVSQSLDLKKFFYYYLFIIFRHFIDY